MRFFLLFLFLLFLSYFFLPSAAFARDAALYISPLTAVYSLDKQPAPAQIWLKVGDFRIDTVQGTITFSTSSLNVEDIRFYPPFTVFVREPNIDQNNGIIEWSVAALGGVNVDTLVAEIVFSSKVETEAFFAPKEVSILSYGQNVPVVPGPQTRYLFTAESEFETNKNEAGSTTQDISGERPQTSILTDLDNKISSTSLLRDDRPVVRGHSELPYALVAINIDQGLVQETVNSDGDGEWVYRFPYGLAPGRYVVKVTATDPVTQNIFDTDLEYAEVVRSDVAQSLLSIDIMVPQQVRKRQGVAQTTIRLTHAGNIPSNQQQIPLVVELLLVNEDDSIVWEEHFPYTLSQGEETIERTIVLDSSLPSGDYSVSAQLLSQGTIVSSDADTFSLFSFIDLKKWGVPLVSILAIGFVYSFMFFGKKKPSDSASAKVTANFFPKGDAGKKGK